MSIETQRKITVLIIGLIAGAIAHWGVTPTPNPTPVPPAPIVVPVNPSVTTIPVVPVNPLPVNPSVTTVPVVPVNPVNPTPVNPVNPVNPTPVNPTPVDPPPTPKPTPVPLPTDIGTFISELDKEITDAETQKDDKSKQLAKLITLLQGIVTKHGLISIIPVDPPKPVDPVTPVNPVIPTPVNPTPVNPTPVQPIVPQGFRVIFYFDTMADNTEEQRSVIYSTAIRDYLNSHCVKSSTNWPEWRVYNPLTEFGVTTKESQTMVDLWNTAKAQAGPILTGKAPQLIVAVNGSVKIYPLPVPEANALTFLKSIGGN